MSSREYVEWLTNGYRGYPKRSTTYDHPIYGSTASPSPLTPRPTRTIKPSVFILDKLHSTDSFKLGSLVRNTTPPYDDVFDPSQGWLNSPEITVNGCSSEEATRLTNNSKFLNNPMRSYELQGGSVASLTTAKTTIHSLTNPHAWFNPTCARIIAREWLENTFENGTNVYLVAGLYVFGDERLAGSTTPAKTTGETTKAPIPSHDGRILDRLPRYSRRYNGPSSGWVFAVQYYKVELKPFSTQGAKSTIVRARNRWRYFGSQRPAKGVLWLEAELTGAGPENPGDGDWLEAEAMEVLDPRSPGDEDRFDRETREALDWGSSSDEDWFDRETTEVLGPKSPSDGYITENSTLNSRNWVGGPLDKLSSILPEEARHSKIIPNPPLRLSLRSKWARYRNIPESPRKLPRILPGEAGHGKIPEILLSPSSVEQTLLLWEDRKGVEELLQSELAEMQKTPGVMDPRTLVSTANLAEALSRQRKWEKAKALLQPALPMMKKTLGEDNPDTLKAVANLANALANEGLWGEVKDILVPVLSQMKEHLSHNLYTDSESILKTAFSKPEGVKELAQRAIPMDSKPVGSIPAGRRRRRHKPNKTPIPEKVIVPYLSSVFGHKNSKLGLRISLDGFLLLPPSVTHVSEASVEFRGFEMNYPFVADYWIMNGEVHFRTDNGGNVRKMYTGEELCSLFQTSLLGLLKNSYVKVAGETERTSCQWLAQEFDDRARLTIWSVIAGIDGVENIEVGRLDGTRDDRFAVAYRNPEVQTPLSPLQRSILPWVEIRSVPLPDPALRNESSLSNTTLTVETERFIPLTMHYAQACEPSPELTSEPSFEKPSEQYSESSPNQYLVAGSKLRPELEYNMAISNINDPVTAQSATFGCFLTKLGFTGEEDADYSLGGLTIGHAVLDGTVEAYIVTEDETTSHTVKIHESFRRLCNKPKFMWKSRFMDGSYFDKQLHEVVFLEVPPHHQIVPEIENLDCRALANTLERTTDPSIDEADSEADQFSPLVVSTSVLWQAAHLQEPMIVYKDGAASGLTQGHLVGLCYSRPKSKHLNKGKRAKDMKDPFWGIVEWIKDENQFSKGGDSGAMVYVKSKDGLVTPIGIHSGAVDDRSYFLILSTAVNVIEEVIDYDLEFVKSQDTSCKSVRDAGSLFDTVWDGLNDMEIGQGTGMDGITHD